MKSNLKTKVGKVIVFLSDEELETSNQALDFQLAANSEFMRGKAYEAKRVRKKIHEIFEDGKDEKDS